MRLPNARRAIIDDAKIRRYLLSPEHAIGRGKASFFNRLGYARYRWRELRRDLIEVGRSGTVTSTGHSVFGRKYEVHGTIHGPNGRKAKIVTIWIIVESERFPRLVTAYPREAP
jgi:Domain of unknown function (DUF6883)